MYRTTLGLVLILLSGLGAVAQDAGTEDSKITARVETTFLLNRHLNPFNINTNTKDGVVTIAGSVGDEVQRDLAEELARAAKGVRSVKNEIVVVPTTYGDKERRSFRQKIEDKTVTASVRTRLLYHREFKGLKIGVSAVNNVVTLHGIVNSESQKNRIHRVVLETKGVDSLVNNLTIHQKEELHGLDKVGRFFSDEWLESRVETAILLNRHVSIRELDVEVNDGICILSGIVGQKEKKQAAGAVAQSIQGVKSVKNEIQVRVPIVRLEGLDAEQWEEDTSLLIEQTELSAP
jgi:osmotically-inducible protein OsmY